MASMTAAIFGNVVCIEMGLLQALGRPSLPGCANGPNLYCRSENVVKQKLLDLAGFKGSKLTVPSCLKNSTESSYRQLSFITEEMGGQTVYPA